jgi:hypothetical protein
MGPKEFAQGERLCKKSENLGNPVRNIVAPLLGERVLEKGWRNS